MSSGLLEDIPVDVLYADHDDGSYGTLSSRSISSSVHTFHFENGRRYQGYREGAHFFPNDSLTQQNERITHHLFLLLFHDLLFFSPLKSPQNVIDLGTGTGLWASDMADRYEDAKVRGVDLADVLRPTQPNLEFEIDDIRKDWPPRPPFDLIHIRLLFGTIDDWPALYKQAFDNLESGGYIEQAEVEIKPLCDDGTMPEDSIFIEWREWAMKLGENIGKEFLISDAMKGYMQQAGFVDVVEKRFKVPLGPWSNNERYREIGKYYEAFWRTGAQGWIMAPMTRFLGWTPERVNEFCQRAYREIEERKQHVYYTAVVIYARKP